MGVDRKTSIVLTAPLAVTPTNSMTWPATAIKGKARQVALGEARRLRVCCATAAAAEANTMAQITVARRFIPALYAIVGAGAVALLSAQPPARFDLAEATVEQLQARMSGGQDTARSLVDKYLARIQVLDRSGPALHSVLEINPEAASIADSLDLERKAGRIRGPLHGIPVLIKDNIATHDRMMTTAGSLALEGAPAPKDAFIVTRLREAGAVILGKTNLSEWAKFPARRTRPAAGADAADRQRIRMRSIATRRDRAPIRRRHRGQPRGDRGGDRNRRLDRLAVSRPLARRHQAHPWPRQPQRASSPSRNSRTPPARWRGR